MTGPQPLAPPAPLVNYSEHPWGWLRNKIILTVDAVVLAHVGVLIMAALYYLVTQTNPTVKHWWDTTVTPASLRHDIRDVAEGVLASCLAQAIVWNPFTPAHQNPGRLFRELRQRFGVPVGLAAVVSAVAIGSAAFMVGEALLHLLHVHAISHPVTGSLWHRTTTAWESNWDKKALGFVSALAARRPLHVLFDEAQAYFVGRRAAAGTGLRWLDPPVFKARYHYLTEHPHELRDYPKTLTYLMGIVVVACVALAGYGYYILTYQA